MSTLATPPGRIALESNRPRPQQAHEKDPGARRHLRHRRGHLPHLGRAGRAALPRRAQSGETRRRGCRPQARGAAYVGTAVADLDDTDKHAELLSHAINSLTGMDIAYLAYGILGDQPRAEQDFEHAAQILHTNFVAPVSLLTWLANFCVQRHAGVLAVISSVAGDRGRKSNYLYGSSKAGLTAFLAGLRNRIDREGVTVLTIKPGPVNTAMTAHMNIRKLPT